MASNHFYLRISAGKEGFMETMNVVEKRAVELNEVLEKRGSGFQVQYRKVTKNLNFGSKIGSIPVMARN